VTGKHGRWLRCDAVRDAWERIPRGWVKTENLRAKASLGPTGGPTMWQALVYNEAPARVAGGLTCLPPSHRSHPFPDLVMFFKTVFGNHLPCRVQRLLVGLVAAVVLFGPAATMTLACPFCSAVSQTI